MKPALFAKGNKRTLNNLLELRKQAKSLKETAAQFLGCIEVAIVGGHLSCVMPYSLHGIKFRRIGRQQEDFHLVAVLAKPVIHLGLLMI